MNAFAAGPTLPGTIEDPALRGTLEDPALRAEAEEILYLYATLYPARPLRIFLYRTESPDWGAPEVIEGALVLTPDHLSPDFLGTVETGPDGPDADQVSVFVAVPRKPTAEEIVASPESGALRSRKTRALFRLSPVLFEYAKFLQERRARRRSADRDRWEPLPRSSAPVLAARPAAEGAPRPAILIGLHWLETGGAEKLAFDTVGWALEAGLRVFVMAEKPGLHRLAARLPVHLDLHFLRTDRYLAREAVTPFLNRLVARENIRLLHIHHCIPLYEALPTLKAFHPELQVLDSTHIIEHANGGYARIAGVWSGYVDRHHVISRELETMFRDRFQVRDKVLLGRMLTRDPSRPARPGFSMAPGGSRYTVAFVGRMGHQKRPVVLALILRALRDWGRKAGIEFRFEIVGEGPYLPAFKALVAKYRLGEITGLHPAGIDVPALMQGADLLLLPSSNEGLALVCYEAIEHGAIPVSTDVGAQSELMPAELLLDPDPRRAAGQTVKIVSKLINDPAFLERATRDLAEGYARVTGDPTAREVLMPLYEAAAAT